MLHFIIQVSRVSPFFASITSLGIGLLVFLYNHKDEKNRSFFYFSIVLSGWAFGCFIQSITSDYATALLWDKLLYSVAVFAPILLFQLCISFTTKQFRMTKYAAWVMGVLLLILNWESHFRTGVTFNFGARFVTDPAIGWYAYLTLYGILICLALYELYLEKKRHSGIEQERLGYLFLAMFILILGGNSYFTLVLFKITPLIDSLLNLFSSLLLSIYCLIMSYLIVKHDLMDMTLIVTRSVSYVITSVSVIITFLFIPLLPTPYSWILAGILGLIWARFGQTIHLFIQTTAEKKFLKGTYDYREVLTQFTSRFSRCASVSEVITALDFHLVHDIEIRASAVLIPEGFDEKKELSGPYISASSHTRARLTESDELLKQLYAAPEIIYAHHSLEVAKTLAMLGCTALVPCMHNDQLMAILLLGQKMSNDGFTRDDKGLFPLLGAQIGIVLNRLRQTRFEAELNIAQRIQSEILPRNPSISNLELACLMIPATEMGGDYYDIIHTPTGTWILLGDVTGHGVGSAMVMFMVQSIVTTLVKSNSVTTPSELLYNANRILCQNMQRLDEGRPLTIVALHTVDGRHFSYCGAHDAIMILRNDQAEVEMVEIDQFPFGIGMIEEMTLEEFGSGTLSLDPGDILFIGTDGITEAAKNGRYTSGTFGEAGLADCLITHRTKPLTEFSDTLINQLKHYTNNTFHDDITFIAARSV